MVLNFILVIAISCLLFSNYCTGKQIGQDVIQSYVQKLDQEDALLKNQFRKALGISQEGWDSAIAHAHISCDSDDADFKKEYQNNDEVHSELRELATNLLKERGIDPSKIALINNSPQSPTSCKSSIGLSIEFFSMHKATHEEKEAVIMHEIAHIIHKDSIVWRAMLDLVERAPFYKKPQGLLIMRKWSLFREKRADLIAGLSGYRRAQALAHFYKKLLESKQYNVWINVTHPKLQKRIAYLNDLSKAIENGENRLSAAFFDQGIEAVKALLCIT
jgi:hypothetical protein